jgi:hypothetical protein
MLSLLVELYRYGLEPIPPFTWLGIGISTLDVVAIIRLCVVLRQIREISMKEHVKSHGMKGIEQDSFVKKAATTLLIVYGGEAITGAVEIFVPFPTMYKLFENISSFLGYPPLIYDVGCRSSAIHINAGDGRIYTRHTRAQP